MNAARPFQQAIASYNLMPMTEPQMMFLDVASLMETSQPRGRVPWLWIFLGVFGGIIILSFNVAQEAPQAHNEVWAFSMLLMGGLLAFMMSVGMASARSYRAEQKLIDGIGELIQLRRWPQAAMLLEQTLSRPARTMSLRTQALIFLTTILSRYHRFEDALAIQNYLLDEPLVDGSAAVALRFGRAMAMLREDHLFDADRAINELRRTNGAAGSAALALVELYRDVKTGHPDDALRLFEEKRTLLRDQLGHRVADAYALAARAYDLQGRESECAQNWQSATLLAPAGELTRRYPEVEKLVGRYAPANAPAELNR